MAVKINQLGETHSSIRTLVVGMNCRNIKGFLFIWIYLLDFLWNTRRAPGVLQVYPGIIGPFQLVLVSYWDSESAMMRFVGSSAHRRWMRFIIANPNSLNLFNETYDAPVAANFIGSPGGYAAARESAGETTTDLISYVRRTG